MLSVSANQVSRLAIKSAQVASVQNELLATTECEESFPPLSQNQALKMESDSCWIERSVGIPSDCFLFVFLPHTFSPSHYHVTIIDGEQTGKSMVV